MKYAVLRVLPEVPPGGVCAGIDWASADHAVCVVDMAGRVTDQFAAAHDRAGIAGLIARLGTDGAGEVAIERGDGVLVDALLAAGLTVVVIGSRQVKNLRSRYGSSGAKDDRFDSFVLADALRTDRARLRPLVPDSAATAALRAAVPDPSPEAVRALPEEVKAKVLTLVGLDRCAFAASGAAPIDPGIIEFFQALGLPIVEGWGMSELCNAATIAVPGDSVNGAVGRAYPGVELRIADDGEVLVRGPLVMTGYYRDEERTAEAVDADGWMHTGDIGELDADGFLKITDRKKDLLITSGGKNISPALVEYELQRHPLIGQACAIGDRRNYLTALLVLDPEAVRAWAEREGLVLDSMAAAATDARVRGALAPMAIPAGSGRDPAAIRVLRGPDTGRDHRRVPGPARV